MGCLGHIFVKSDRPRLIPASDDYVDDFTRSESFSHSTVVSTHFSVVSSGRVTRQALGAQKGVETGHCRSGRQACVRALGKAWHRVWGTWGSRAERDGLQAEDRCVQECGLPGRRAGLCELQDMS